MNNNISLFHDDYCYLSNNETYYQILNVSSSASYIDIKEAYRQKVLQCHPDKRKQPNLVEGKDVEDDDWFHRIQEAYETLRDQKRRQDYDMHLLFLKSKENCSAHDDASTGATRVPLSILQCELVDVVMDQPHPTADNLDTKNEKKQEQQLFVKPYKVEKLYSLQCRCGDWIEILESDLSRFTNTNVTGKTKYLGSDTLHCSSCSFSIWIDISS
jgi:curved DNA-binding protein CbpA